MAVVEELYRSLVDDDELPSVNKWPPWWKDILLKPNKSHGETYRVFCFLVRNGVTPQHAGKYILWWANRGVLCTNPHKTKEHVKSMTEDWLSGNPAKLYNYFIVSVMDLNEGKPWSWKGSREEFVSWWQNRAPEVGGELEELIQAAELNEEDEDYAKLMDRAILEHEVSKKEAEDREALDRAQEVGRKRRKRIVDAAVAKWGNKD